MEWGCFVVRKLKHLVLSKLRSGVSVTPEVNWETLTCRVIFLSVGILRLDRKEPEGKKIPTVLPSNWIDIILVLLFL